VEGTILRWHIDLLTCHLEKRAAMPCAWVACVVVVLGVVLQGGGTALCAGVGASDRTHVGDGAGAGGSASVGAGGDDASSRNAEHRHRTQRSSHLILKLGGLFPLHTISGCV
jgi:hypothetical protein